jgi:hypothetical protein
MPKEVIYGDRSFPAYGTPVAPEAWSVIEVGWSREAEYVQIASKTIDAIDGSDFHPQLEPIEVGVGETVLLEAEGIRPGGIYLQMTRSSINELIRVLKRARDQAFGRDE